MQNKINKLYYKTFPIFYFLCDIANAGGIKEEGVSLLTTIRSAIVAIVAVACSIMLIFEGIQGYSGRKTWGEVGVSCLWILFIGGAISIATWIFTKGQHINMN